MKDIDREQLKQLFAAEKVINTGLAIVLLTQKHAYKIGKIVKDFPLIALDTAEKVQKIAELNFAFNRTISPSIYEELVDIYQDQDGHLSLQPNGTLIGKAIKMRRLNEQDNLHVKLKNNIEITNTMIERLADLLANCHQQLKSQPMDPKFNYFDSITGNILENLPLLKKYLPNDSDISATDEALTITTKITQLTQNTAIFAERLHNNKVQCIHGDSHASNIFIPENSAELIDAVLPITRLTHGDVAIDVAALAMNFDAFGLTAQANSLVTAYKTKTDDTSLPKVIPFYKLYWALIRFRVALFTLDNNSDAKSDEKAAARAEALLYKKLIMSYLAITPHSEARNQKSTPHAPTFFNNNGSLPKTSKTNCTTTSDTPPESKSSIDQSP